MSATGSSTGVEVTFTPATLLTGDVFRYWAVDSSAGSNSEPRLTEAAVSSWTAGSGERMGMLSSAGIVPTFARVAVSEASQATERELVPSELGGGCKLLTAGGERWLPAFLQPLQVASASSRCRFLTLTAPTCLTL